VSVSVSVTETENGIPNESEKGRGRRRRSESAKSVESTMSAIAVTGWPMSVANLEVQKNDATESPTIVKIEYQKNA
jgi:hypothetical protein